ncbi:hypothetical protein PIROE2DRAFT_59070 [Piromyces sp. E2]|nr:hypothetical protein PIROE2DRAFT_59070 [Piromyces sp. E2]|eukprot:OUM66987.1 hypothetical protein PIROE2DRAFT_59070 [Piromyces sp. E2]
MDCDFNCVVDEYGNTPVLFLLLIKDYTTVLYLLYSLRNIDLSIKNYHGINASYLYFYIDKKEERRKKTLFNYRTFDHTMIDKYNNNLLIHCIAREDYVNDFYYIARDLVKHEELFNMVNEQKENFIIVATKLGHLDVIRNSFMNKVNINQQDWLGNTAMYYAVKLKDAYAVNKLAFYHADSTIKNNEGVSAFDLANEMEEKNIINILKRPIDPEKWNKKNNSKVKIFSMLKHQDSSDEKINKYIKNYQIKNYQKDYDYILVEPENPYTPPEKIEINHKRLFSTYFPEEGSVLNNHVYNNGIL